MHNKIATIAAIGLGLSVVALDFSVVFTALSAIQYYFDASIGAIQWIMNIYGIAISTFLVTMGRIADRIGRKRFFILGVSTFGIASLFAGLCLNAGYLIFFRGIQGIASAIILPVSQTLMVHQFPENKTGKAIGIWTAIVGLAMAIGPTFGGFIVSYLGWRWIFFINVPIIFLSLVLIPRFILESREKEKRPIDWKGLAFLFFFISPLAFAIVEGPNFGWTSFWTLSFFAVSILGLIQFILHESKIARPIINPEFFFHPRFVYGAVANFCLLFIVWSGFFIIPIYLHTIWNLKTVQVGLTLLLITIPVMIFSIFSGTLHDRIGPKLSILTGFSFLLLSAVIQAFFSLTTPFWLVGFAILCLGMGWGFAWSPCISTAISGIDPAFAALASGSVITIQEIGGSLGLALSGTLFRISSGSSLEAHAFLTGYAHVMWLLFAIALIGCLLGFGIRSVFTKKL